MMTRLARTVTMAAIAACAWRAAHAQATSPLDDLLKGAQGALENLQYAKADTLARQVLLPAVGATPRQRVRALMLRASALYPDEPEHQRRESAMRVLAQLVRPNLSIRLPRDLTWSGLDSLLEQTRRTAFGIDLSIAADQMLTGPDGRLTVTVKSNRPIQARLRFDPASPSVTAAGDGGGPSANVALSVRGMRDGQPALVTGKYLLTVVVVDPASGDSVAVAYDASVDAPAFELAASPARPDSTQTLPERGQPYGKQALVVGFGFGAVTWLLSSGLRADGISSTASSSYGAVAAAVVAGGIIWSGLTDRGRPLQANAASNRARQSAFEALSRATVDENRRRLVTYAIKVHVNPEAR